MGDYLAESIVLEADKLQKKEAANRKFVVLKIHVDGPSTYYATWQRENGVVHQDGIPQTLCRLSEDGFTISDSLVEQINALFEKEASQGFNGSHKFLLAATKDE